MRESNFSIPNANKASVGITPALYDRRALDCTSTLPLINSLNNLAYLTTSSARIRDILTVDGGVERLVCILKRGRSNDLMEMWKWNLTFQCVVNLGVRGSESVRRRVVEADIVPVVATILDNYIQAIEKCRERDQARHAASQHAPTSPKSERHGHRLGRTDPRHSHSSRSDRSRRTQAPPPPPPPLDLSASTATVWPRDDAIDPIPSRPTHPPLQRSVTSPIPRRLSSISQEPLAIPPFQGRQHRSEATSPTGSPLPSSDTDRAYDSSSPFRASGMRGDSISTIPSMLPAHAIDASSQPTSPSTPTPSQSQDANTTDDTARNHSTSQTVGSETSWDRDEQNETDESETQVTERDGHLAEEPAVEIQVDMIMRDVRDTNMLDGSTTPVPLDSIPTVNVADADVFMTTRHRAEPDDSANHTATNTPAQAQPGFGQQVQPLALVNAAANGTPPSPRNALDTFYGQLPSMPNLFAALPREEDVVMALQLLAYVSKYCNLRSFFQATHLVARLKVGDELRALDDRFDAGSIASKTRDELEEEWDNEYVCEDGRRPYNIFPLIERFTVKPARSHGAAHGGPAQIDKMQYWAGVVMRNLCRKDEGRGGIRQCAYWQCGKWEEYPRQFAKCRRCRRTKYCSKECQKGAWGTHRFWCVAADDGREPEGSRPHHYHHHHHHHHHHHNNNHNHLQHNHDNHHRHPTQHVLQGRGTPDVATPMTTGTVTPVPVAVADADEGPATEVQVPVQIQGPMG